VLRTFQSTFQHTIQSTFQSIIPDHIVLRTETPSRIKLFHSEPPRFAM
jgi:hypothetical protein